MSALEELAFYCRKKDPMGAFALLGESGCGKTYLIKNDLCESLKDTHVIVHMSLFGIRSLDDLHTEVKKNWVRALVPVLTHRKIETYGSGIREFFLKATTAVLKTVNPKAGSLADAASDPMKYIVVTPEVEDIYTKTKKEVVLVFDDADRTGMDLNDLLGAVNDYCENQHFHIIVVASRRNISDTKEGLETVIRKAREKTIAYTVYNYPDFGEIVHRVIEDRNWSTEEYAAFLKAHEQTVLDLFGSDDAELESFGTGTTKNHNIRSLITGLESFYRIYYYMAEAEVPDIEPYLCAFLPAYFIAKSGVCRKGMTTYSVSEEEIVSLYPRFSPGNLFESVRLWITLGYWNSGLFEKELAACIEQA